MAKKPFLFVALDSLTTQEEYTRKIAYGLSSYPGSSADFGFKINLDYILKKGARFSVGRIKKKLRCRIFADLKMWNGSRTMTDIAKELVDLEIDYLNVYALADNQIKEMASIVKGTKTKLLGLTILSHYDDAYCQKHFRRSLNETVRHFSETAIDNGCDGIILPGTTLDSVVDLKTIKVVPGVRPKWFSDTRHKEEVEPSVAVEKGADILVCGSPIMKADNKAAALTLILQEMNVSY